MRVHTVFLSLAAVLSGTCFLSQAQALAENQPDLVQAPVEKVYVPLGFDDNDNVEVVLHGHFNSSCYKVGPTSARVDYDNHTIAIDSKAFLYREGNCAQMIVPFTETISLGLVKKGTYQIVVNGQLSFANPSLEIKAATSSDPDDFLYAPVETVSLETTSEAHHQVTIEGRYPHMFIGCMIIRDVKVQKTAGQVIVVQPIAELTDGDECEPQSVTKKFVVSKTLDFNVDKAEYLLHSRATSGHSVNRLVDVD